MTWDETNDVMHMALEDYNRIIDGNRYNGLYDWLRENNFSDEAARSFLAANYVMIDDYYSWYEWAQFPQDMKTQKEYDNRKEANDIAPDEQQVYDAVSARLMAFNSYLQPKGKNIWEKYSSGERYGPSLAQIDETDVTTERAQTQGSSIAKLDSSSMQAASPVDNKEITASSDSNRGNLIDNYFANLMQPNTFQTKSLDAGTPVWNNPNWTVDAKFLTFHDGGVGFAFKFPDFGLLDKLDQAKRDIAALLPQSSILDIFKTGLTQNPLFVNPRINDPNALEGGYHWTYDEHLVPIRVRNESEIDPEDLEAYRERQKYYEDSAQQALATGQPFMIGGMGRIPSRGRLVQGSSKAVNGKWVQVSESMSDASRAYQRQITGTDQVWMQNGVKFDGMKDGVLVEAKGSYANFVDKNTGKFQEWFMGKDSLIDQANRQLHASEGYPINWYFADEASMIATQKLFQREGITGINFIFKPLE